MIQSCQSKFVTYFIICIQRLFFVLVLKCILFKKTVHGQAYWCIKVQCVRLIYISFFNITNTSHRQHIICMMDRPDVVEREMFSTEFSTGTTLLNERQTLAFLLY